jgi:hypothetical protein
VTIGKKKIGEEDWGRRLGKKIGEANGREEAKRRWWSDSDSVTVGCSKCF